MRSAIGAAVMVLLSSGLAQATVQVIGVDSATEIVGPEGGSRVVLKCDDLSFLSGRRVVRGVLEVPLGDVAVPRDLRLLAFPASREWDFRTVSWDEPWVRPGGDWNDEFVAEATARAGERGMVLRFDVGPFLREFGFGQEANMGFILMPSSGSGRTFEDDERGLLSALSGARIEVSHRPVPAALRNR